MAIRYFYGDVLDAGSVEQLPEYPAQIPPRTPQSTMAQRAYDAAVGIIHSSCHWCAHRPKRTCAQMRSIPRDSCSPVTVYFGHTHVAIDGLELDEIRFYNLEQRTPYAVTHFASFQINP
ncbi:MAG: hypothetical protein R3C53_13925 [Pirellulaceae bacterium]